MNINNITLSYGTDTILEDISCNFGGTELIFLLGANGCGKSTLLKAIMGFLPLQQGEITIDNKAIFTAKERARLLSYLPQQSQIPTDYTALDFIIMGITPHLSFFEQPSEKHRATAEKSMAALHITHLRDKKIGHLSGGQLQLVLLARCIMQGSRYLLLDEAASHLDYGAQHEFLEILKNYLQLSQKTAIISSHDPNLALRFADRILCLQNKHLYADLSATLPTFTADYAKVLEVIYKGNTELIQNETTSFINWRGFSCSQ